MRSLARECVFQYLFSRLFNPDDEGLFDVLIKDLSNDDKSFATDLKNFVLSNEESYLQSLSELSIGYKLERIHNTDKIAILIGMAEFDNYKNTPKIVIIDECVKLASKFSTDNSPDFVNGIMAVYTQEN